MATRILSCGVELEFEVRPLPGTYFKHKEIFDNLPDQHELIFAAVIQKGLTSKSSNMTCMGVNSSEYAAAVADGSIHKSWKVMSEMGIAPVGQPDNCTSSAPLS